MKAVYRVLRRTVRKATKPLVLRFNCWQHRRCEEHVKRYSEMRHGLVQLEVTERRRQVALAVRRCEITRW